MAAKAVAGMKIRWALPVWVRFPPPAPSNSGDFSQPLTRFRATTAYRIVARMIFSIIIAGVSPCPYVIRCVRRSKLQKAAGAGGSSALGRDRFAVDSVDRLHPRRMCRQRKLHRPKDAPPRHSPRSRLADRPKGGRIGCGAGASRKSVAGNAQSSVISQNTILSVGSWKVRARRPMASAWASMSLSLR